VTGRVADLLGGLHVFQLERSGAFVEIDGADAALTAALKWL